MRDGKTQNSEKKGDQEFPEINALLISLRTKRVVATVVPTFFHVIMNILVVFMLSFRSLFLSVTTVVYMHLLLNSLLTVITTYAVVSFYENCIGAINCLVQIRKENLSLF